MYMYPVITTNPPTEVSSTNTNTTINNMPRNRSLSAAASPPPALLSRGFASLRRAHRRLSNSSASPPSAPGTEANNITSPAIAGDSTIPAENNITESNLRPRIRLVPNVGLSNRSFVFEIIDRELEPGAVYHIGRFSDRNAITERLSFKSKVVSRNHAELWTENGKAFIRDIGSSSGTFLNRIRLSPPSHVSSPHEIKDGDAIQLGVDYQGGIEPIYRAVRIRVEINRQSQSNNPFARVAFQQLRSHLVSTSVSVGSPPQDSLQPVDLGLHRVPTKTSDVADIQMPLADMMSRHKIREMSRSDIQECCICLFAIAPFQALFIAPCSHIFHFKCLRPIVFQNYPGFSCPLCRSYFDLEASVSVEVEEVLEAISIAKEKQKQQEQLAPPIDTVPELNEEEEAKNVEQNFSGADSPIIPNSNIVNHGVADENVGKNRLGTTPPVAYVNTPEEENSHADETFEQPAASSSSQPITMNSNRQHLQVRSNRNGETFFSSTLVGSPIFDDSVMPLQNNNVVT